jgi:hypothetical protein
MGFIFSMVREVDSGPAHGAAAFGGGGGAQLGVVEGGIEGRWARPVGGQGPWRSRPVGQEARSSGRIWKKMENQFKIDFELSKAIENHTRRIWGNLDMGIFPKIS